MEEQKPNEEQMPNNEPTTHEEIPQFTELKNTFRYFPFRNQKQPIVVLILVGLIFYFTSLFNEYALDDGIIIHQNEHVMKGVRGINKIMTKDGYDSFYRRMNAKDQLLGGRYRPLPVISFAIEQEFIGAYPSGLYDFNCWDQNKDNKSDVNEDLNHDGVFNEIDCQVKGAAFRHFNNIWTYILACVLLYLVFRNHMFKNNQDMAFLSALIFMAHPIHSSVIANIASRNEIFSLLFISLTLLFSFRYLENKKLSTLFWAALMYLLALFSKEYAFLLLALLPIGSYVFTKIEFNPKAILLPCIVFLAFCLGMVILDEKKMTWFGVIPITYIVLAAFCFRKTLLQKNLNTLLIWLFGAFLLYLGMRLNATILFPGFEDTELLNNPYVLANGEEKFCTKAFVWLKYFTLLWFPHPLSSDYSYQTILYRHFGDWDFILSVLLHLTLLYLGIKLIIKRHALGFAISVYFAFLALTGNIFFSIGGVMNERYLFHPSIGFAIAFSWLALYGMEKLLSLSFNAKRIVLFGSIGIIVFLFGCKTWERNADWKNDITLFIKDVTTTPNSVLVLGNAGARWIDMCDYTYFSELENKTTTLPFSTYTVNMLRFKVSEKELKDGVKAKDNIIEPLNEGTNNSQNFTQRELCLYKGIGYLKHAVCLHPRYVNGYLNLGLAYFKLKREREMIFYWKHAERLYPNNPYLKNYYVVTYNMLLKRGLENMAKGRTELAVEDFNKCVIVDKDNPEGWYNLSVAYSKMGKTEKANMCMQKTLKLNPNYPSAGQKALFDNSKSPKEGC